MNGFYFIFLSRQDLQDEQDFFTVSGRNRENYIRLRRKTSDHTFADCVASQKVGRATVPAGFELLYHPEYGQHGGPPYFGFEL